MLVASFSAFHEAAEYLMGHPIWTHHFADKQLTADMQALVAKQCPGMPTPSDAVCITQENWREKLAKLEAEFGPTQTIRKGPGLTALLPTDGIPDRLKDKTIFIDAKKPRE
jgi:hypothetical protein